MDTSLKPAWHLQKDLEKKINDAFQELQYKTHQSPDTLFDHFLEFVIHGWAVNAKPLSWWKYNAEQNLLFKNVFTTWIEALNEALQVSPWYDFLGAIYETFIAGIRRRQGAGQFFTPQTICDMMAKMTSSSDQKQDTLADTCCGSGRMLLAAHAENPSILFYGKDLDRTCCMMTVCNMLVHGCRGTVEWGNSLIPDDVMETWEVNPLLGTNTPFGVVPHIHIVKR